VFRFHAVYRELRNVAGGRYTDFLLDHYYDQSHFLKNFKRYTGLTPRAYVNVSDYGRIYIPH
jgi:methylphosphotriester-DNA--protein-cysteine methyltransferase